MIRILKITGKVILLGIAGLLLAFLIPYLTSPVFRFPDTRPFHGEQWYNPYEEQKPLWLKANFHAHTIAWKKVTNGNGTPESMYRVYRNMGYDIIGISNYMQILPDSLDAPEYIPVYEHGYNAWKAHQLNIGAREVTWRDYIYFQPPNMQQHILKRLRPRTEIIALAHPGLRKGYKPRSLKRLSGYDMFEVYNRHKYYGKLWDVALSAGNPSWALGDDDVHDIGLADEVGKAWNMINVDSRSPSAIYDALGSGRSYVVHGTNGQSDLTLKSLRITGDTLVVEISRAATVTFIGQDGLVRKTFENEDVARLGLEASDTYIRTEIKDEIATLVLNPIIRYDGVSLHTKSAEINWILTFLYWVGILLVTSVCIWVWIYIRKKRNRSSR